MNLQYSNFYKQYGIRRPQQLIAPPMASMDTFAFPRNSMFHYVSHDESTLTPDPTQSYFARYSKRIYMDVVTALTSTTGNAKRSNTLAQNLYRAWFMQHQKLFKFMRDPAKQIKDPTSLLVTDYAYLQKLYRYAAMPLTPYYKWLNIEKTVWTTIQQVSTDSERQNFIFFNVPDIIPSITSLRMYASKVNNSLLSVFDTPEKCFILEVWRWIDGMTRATSILGNLTQDHLNKTNLVLLHNGRWAVLNLGQLNRWRQEVKEVDASGDVDKSKTPVATLTYSPAILQKLFLRLLIGVQSASPESTEDIISVEQPDDEDREYKDAAADDTPLLDTPEIPEITLPKTPPPDKETQPVVLPEIEPHAGNYEDDDLTEEMLLSIDDDLQALEIIENKSLLVRGVTARGKEPAPTPLQKAVETFIATPEEQAALTAEVHEEIGIEDTLKNHIDKYAEYGLMSASDYRKMTKQAEQFMASGAPYSETLEPIREFIKVAPEKLLLSEEEIKLPDIAHVSDKSMLASSLISFDKKYIETVMAKDVTAMTANIQKAGIIIHNYDIERENSVLGEYEVHTLKIKPIDGVNSTLRFRLPKVDTEGNFVANGNKYHMRKQRVDLPIRKISPGRVALTSYYGRVFVDRSTKKVNDTINWLARQILVLGQSGASTHITRVAPANVFDNAFKAPRIYSGLAMYFKSIDVDGYHLVFDHQERLTVVPDQPGKGLTGAATINALEGEQYRLVGADRNKALLFVDYHDNFFVYKDQAMAPIGDIYGLTLIDQVKAPVEFAELRVYAKTIPIGIVLGFMLGLTNLIKLLKVKPRVFEIRQRIDLKADEWVIVFKDKKYVFSRKDALATLVLGGFNEYWKALKNYFVESFDQPNVYLNVLESNGIGTRYLRELELLDQLFIDPVTRDILKEMHEPLTFKGLLLRGSELLTTDAHPDAQDMRSMRIRGYERFSGAVYKEMVNSIRDFKSRNIRGRSQMDMNPYAVWRNITQDPSVEIVKDINPIENLKQIESVTYVGEGGRSKDAMNKASRAFHPSDMGVVSEATVDSADVGVNAYLTANPLFTSVRGLTKPYDKTKDGNTTILSTSAVISPGADHDDPKRVNFISIQQSHTIACQGYRQPQLRTGYEQVLAHRCGEMFAYMAKESGKVISVDPKGIIIEFDSGGRKGVNLGRQYGRAEGSTYPHDIVTSLKVGDTFVAGDAIAYNTGFFEPDFLNPKNVVWKSGLVAKTALYESSQTHEDSSVISSRLSTELTTQTTKVRSFVVNFEQGIKNVLKAGTVLYPSDVLFVIEDEVTNEAGLFDEETLATLQKLSNKAPRAKVKGIVDRIEVYYHGNKDDMSASLRYLANQSDKEFADTAKAVGKPVFSGRVTEEYRVSGTPLALDTAEIKVYITIKTMASIGDKGVFGNQMKSVFGEVMDYEMTTESGEAIDGIFGRRSITARNVLSPDIIGTSITLLNLIAKQAVNLYKG